MRKLFLILLALYCTGCISNMQKSFCLKDKEDAIKLAEEKWLEIYGEKIYTKTPFQAELKDDSIWVVTGTLPKNMVGGVPIARLNAKDCSIISIIHTK